jgi:phospho-N-acetylmuramoyl-pentapeptide-transferase
MLYLLAQHFISTNNKFHLFTYVSFRGLFSGTLSFIICTMYGEKFISWLKSLNVKQAIRDDGPKQHLQKNGTPTMGGLIILFTTTVTSLLLCDLSNPYIWLLIFVMLSTGLLGFVDDYKKVVLKNSKGVSAKTKLVSQLLITTATIFTLIYIVKLPDPTSIIVPYIKSTQIDLGLALFLFLAYIVIVGSSNAVNLTDGLDGLVSFPLIMGALGLSIFAYAEGNHIFADYLRLPHIGQAQEIVVFCGSIIGSILGFLWYNAYPARIFMGDVGSLSLGATFATIAIILKQELVWGVMAMLFVLEALSVIMQVLSYRYRGKKRIFRMAPLHHHFELGGWSEMQVVIRFWILSIIFLIVALLSLKIR